MNKQLRNYDVTLLLSYMQLMQYHLYYVINLQLLISSNRNS